MNGTAGGSSGTTTTTRARGAALARRLGHPATGRALAVAGAALFALAAWLPWQIILVPGATGPTGAQVQFNVTPGDGATLPLLDRLMDFSNLLFAWSVLAVLGLLLAPLLWQRAGAFVTRLSVALFALWALVAAGLSIAEVATLAQSASKPLLCPGRCVILEVTQPIAFGAWLALFALLLALLGA
ncbi:MAG TPA: hypothetical protein VFY89_11235, partial [Ktedonobacterales bacterium]